MVRPGSRRESGWMPFVAVGAVALVLFSFPALLFAEAEDGYAGWKACRACHEKASAEWEKGAHARAFSDLAKKGQEKLPACTPCHVTGYGHPGGFVDGDLTPELAAVQCEACHGPGQKHVSSGGAEAVIAAPGITACRQCHTPGQDPGFDYAGKKAGVHGPLVASAPVTERVSWLSATPERFNFGAIDEGVSASTTIVLQNNGDRDMAITGVRTS